MKAPDYARVVVGISGSLANLAVLHAAVAIAQRTTADLVALSAWVPAGGEIAYRREPCPDLLQLWKQQAHDRITDAFASAFGAPPADVRVQWMTGRGEPGPVLVATADRPGDLLVIGTGRQGPLASRRPGSVSRYCLRHTRGNVLLVPPPDMIDELRFRRRRDKRGILPIRTDEGDGRTTRRSRPTGGPGFFDRR